MIESIAIAVAAAAVCLAVAWFGVGLWLERRESRTRVLRAFHQVIVSAPTPEERRRRFFLIRGGLGAAIGAYAGRIAASSWWHRSHPALITSGVTIVAALTAVMVVQLGNQLPGLPAAPPAIFTQAPSHPALAPPGSAGAPAPSTPPAPGASPPYREPTGAPGQLIALGGSSTSPSASAPAPTTEAAGTPSPTATPTSAPPSTIKIETSSPATSPGKWCLPRAGGPIHLGVCLRGT